MAKSPSIFGYGAPNYNALVFGDGAAQTGFYFRDIGAGIFFDSVKLQNPEPFDHNWNPIIHQANLVSGKLSIQGSTERALSVSFRCHTGSHQHVDDLKQKIGTPFTLEIDELNYENCYIASFKETEWFQGEFEYVVTFLQDTA